MATYKLAAFLALSAASPYCDAFAPGHAAPNQRRASVQLSAHESENAVADGLKKVTGGAAAFLTGMGIMAQVAFADPTAVAPMDQGRWIGDSRSHLVSYLALSIF